MQGNPAPLVNAAAPWKKDERPKATGRRAMAKERIGLVGPGRMGLAMVRHLVRNGYPVTVTDINRKAMEAAEQALEHGTP
jgi:phosphoglycerate dehydrogenase-like enzyme